MMKRLHLLACLLLMAGIVSAQPVRVAAPRVLPPIAESVRTPLMRFDQLPRFVPRRAAVAVDPEHQLWWGYYPDTLVSSISLGSQSTSTYWAAIGIPATESLAQGKSIRAVRFALAGTATYENFHLWIAEKLPMSLGDVKLDVPVATADLQDQAFTEVELPEAYAVPAGKTLYVGYTFSVSRIADGSDYPIIIRYNGANINESLWVNIPDLTAGEWTSQFQSYGPLAMHVLLDGEFPHNAIEPDPTFIDVFTLPGGTVDATVTLNSRGLGKVSSIDYVVGDANSEGAEQHLEFEPIEGMGAQTTVKIPVKADAQPGRTQRYIAITKVNGVANESPTAETNGYCVTLSKAVDRRTVVEEFTGTWCGWCPRGIVGMEQVGEKYGDKAVTIVVHNNDPMEISYGTSAPSFPYAMVDRAISADPYYGVSGDKPAGICDLVGERGQVLAEASVSLLQATLLRSGSVSFKTEVTFSYDSPKAPYAMGYVILADGLKGSGRNWAQANYYAGQTDDYAGDALLKPWTELGGYVSGLSFDHVAIAAKGMDASEGGIKAPIVDGKTLTLNGSISLSGNTVLQSFEGLSVVAVLFNTETGFIVNADVKPVQIAEDFAVNRAQMQAFKPTGIVRGTTGNVMVPLANYGRDGIRSIDYIVRAGGEDSEEMHLDLKQPLTTFGIYTPVAFPMPAQPQTGVLNHTIQITKVNGADNEATSGKSSSGSILTIARQSKRRTVVEEFTGTWCGWCPRGMAALKRVHDEQPDDVVLMAIHGGRDTEPMKVATFNTLLNNVSGFPEANVNRYLNIDPYYGENGDTYALGAIVNEENSQLVEAAVKLRQPTMDEQTGVIDFSTDVTFQLNRTSAPYLLSYVLVADGIKGEGSDWLQTNYYSYYAGSYDDDPYLREVSNEWSDAQEVTFDHVAIAGLGIPSGIIGSLKSTVEEGQTQTHTAKFSVGSNRLAKMAQQMRVIVMLYDKNRKVFINADEQPVVVTDAVHDALDPSAAASAADVYNLAGQRLGAPRRGINIVGGRKVIVK